MTGAKQVVTSFTLTSRKPKLARDWNVTALLKRIPDSLIEDGATLTVNLSDGSEVVLEFVASTDPFDLSVGDWRTK